MVASLREGGWGCAQSPGAAMYRYSSSVISSMGAKAGLYQSGAVKRMPLLNTARRPSSSRAPSSLSLSYTSVSFQILLIQRAAKFTDSVFAIASCNRFSCRNFNRFQQLLGSVDKEVIEVVGREEVIIDFV